MELGCSRKMLRCLIVHDSNRYFEGLFVAGIDRLCSATQAECPSLFMGVRDQLQITRTPLTVEPSRAR